MSCHKYYIRFIITRPTEATIPKLSSHSESEIQGPSSPVVSQFTMQQFSRLKAGSYFNFVTQCTMYRLDLVCIINFGLN